MIPLGVRSKSKDLVRAVLLLLFVISGPVWAENDTESPQLRSVTVAPGAMDHLHGAMELLRDPDGAFDLAWVRAHGDRGLAGDPVFEPLPGQIREGFTRTVLWIRFSAARTDDAPELWWLSFSLPTIDHLTLYHPDGQGGYRASFSGDYVPMSQRAIPMRLAVFPLTLTEAPQTFYLRIESTSTKATLLTLWEPESFVTAHSLENSLLGVLFGVMLTTIIFCILGAFWLRIKLLVVCMFYVFFLSTLTLAMNGYDQYYLYPESPHLGGVLLGVSALLAHAFYHLFFLFYFDLMKTRPRMAWVSISFFAIHVVLAIYSVIWSYYDIASFTQILVIPITIFYTLYAITFFKAMPSYTIFYIIMNGPSAFVLFLRILGNQGVLASTFITNHGWNFSMVILLFTAALVVFMRVKEVYGQSLLAQSKSLEAARRLEETLEERVHRRTAELAEAKARTEELLAKESERHKEQQSLMHMIAHELRTPLSVVEMAIANLKLEVSHATPMISQRFTRIATALTRLNGLVDRVLLEERQVRFAMELERQPTSPGVFLDQILQQVTVPEPYIFTAFRRGEERKILLDPHWLGLAVLNLIDNAVKYTPSGGKITLIVERNPQGLTISVADTGLGLDATMQEKVFEKFFRVAETSLAPATQGLGLGLYLVRQVVELHGGRVWVDSALGQGSTFFLHIPEQA